MKSYTELSTTSKRSTETKREENDTDRAWVCPRSAASELVDIAEKLVHTITNSRDSKRKETLFYLVHGWYAQSTLKVTTDSIRRSPVSVGKAIISANPVMRRRESNRQREIALKPANTYQVDAKDRRAKEHNERISPPKRRRFPGTDRPETTTGTGLQD